MLLPPPVGEVAQDAQADCDGEGNRQAQRHKEHIRTRNVPNEINDFNGFTVPPEKHEINEINDFNDFTVPYEKHDFNEINEITISRPPPKTTKPTVSTKSRFHAPPTESRKQRNPRKKRNARKKGVSLFSLYMDQS